MKIRVLGCSGAIAENCRTTSFLVGDRLLVDAGTGVGDLTLEQMCQIDHVLLTHSHLDHVAALPLMADSVARLRQSPIDVHALPQTIAALKAHIFNNVIWPDFTKLPDAKVPFIQFHEVQVGQILKIENISVEVMPAMHSVPAVGYAVTQGGTYWVFTGDTAHNPKFWQRLNQMDISALVIETAFSNLEQDLARRSGHLAPCTLASELALMNGDKQFPIYITHTKPAETELIMRETQALETLSSGQVVRHDIRWLHSGQEFEL